MGPWSRLVDMFSSAPHSRPPVHPQDGEVLPLECAVKRLDGHVVNLNFDTTRVQVLEEGKTNECGDLVAARKRNVSSSQPVHRMSGPTSES